MTRRRMSRRPPSPAYRQTISGYCLQDAVTSAYIRSAKGSCHTGACARE